MLLKDGSCILLPRLTFLPPEDEQNQKEMSILTCGDNVINKNVQFDDLILILFIYSNFDDLILIMLIYSNLDDLI